MREDCRVGDWLVEPDLGRIRCADKTVHIEPRSMEVLLALCSRPGEVFSKTELLDLVWGGSFVGEESLSHAIWELRRALGDDARHPTYIQTIPKRGYRVLREVVAERSNGGGGRAQAAGSSAAAGRPARTGIWLKGVGAVLLVLVAVLFWRRMDGTEREGETLDVEALNEPDGEPAEPVLSPYRIDGVRVAFPRGLTGDDKGFGIASDLNKLYLVELGEKVVSATAEAGGVVPTHELSTRLVRRPQGGYFAIFALTHLASGQAVIGRRLEIPNAAAVIDAAALVGRYLNALFELDVMGFWEDKDLRDWVDLRWDEPQAIVGFGQGLNKMFRHEAGGTADFDPAIDADADFLAPRIFQAILYRANELDDARVQEHLEVLENARSTATPFLLNMIDWVKAVMEGDEAKQIQALELALDGEGRGNRILLVNLAALYGEDDCERALKLMTPVLLVDKKEDQWEYAGAYPSPLTCAVLTGDIESARRFFETADDQPKVDPRVLLMGLALAIYEEDEERERDRRRRFFVRLREMPSRDDRDPAKARNATRSMRESLARWARSDGREDVAQRLLEKIP